jgi:hypothetical protein
VDTPSKVSVVSSPKDGPFVNVDHRGQAGKLAADHGKKAAQRVYRALIALAHGQPSTDVTNGELVAWTGVRRRCVQLGLEDLERRSQEDLQEAAGGTAAGWDDDDDSD